MQSIKIDGRICDYEKTIWKSFSSKSQILTEMTHKTDLSTENPKFWLESYFDFIYLWKYLYLHFWPNKYLFQLKYLKKKHIPMERLI